MESLSLSAILALCFDIPFPWSWLPCWRLLGMHECSRASLPFLNSPPAVAVARGWGRERRREREKARKRTESTKPCMSTMARDFSVKKGSKIRQCLVLCLRAWAVKSAFTHPYTPSPQAIPPPTSQAGNVRSKRGGKQKDVVLYACPPLSALLLALACCFLCLPPFVSG